MALVYALVSGCSSLGSSKPDPMAPIQDVSYKQLIQPAFANDFANKRVRFDAAFFATMNLVMDLPSKYQDQVRIHLCSSSNPPQCSNPYYDVLIAKEKSTPIFDIRQGANVRITALAVPIKAIAALSGGSSKKLLLLVESIEAGK